MPRADPTSDPSSPPVPIEVSVVIPTTGRWDLLETTLRSVLGQATVDLEVIVVLDAEVQATEQRLAGLGDPRVRSLATPGRIGPAAGRNLGLQDARGTWVSFLDHDDLWAPEKLRRQVDAAVAGGADWAYAPAVDIDDAGAVVGADDPPAPDDIWPAILHRNPIPAGASNLLIRTTVARELGGFDPELPNVCDWDLALRLAERGPGGRADGWLIAYRRHASNMHTDDPTGFLADLQALSDKHRDQGFSPDRVAISRWLAGGQRRAGHRGRAVRMYLRTMLRERSPGDGLRALGTLGGERAMAVGRRARVRGAGALPDPGWMAVYR